MADFTTVTTVPSEAEAEMICARLREVGIECFQRKANLAASIEAAPYAGPRDVLVEDTKLDDARELLASFGGG
jgi:Putative prokaryotic signal transducing protein